MATVRKRYVDGEMGNAPNIKLSSLKLLINLNVIKYASWLDFLFNVTAIRRVLCLDVSVRESSMCACAGLCCLSACRNRRMDTNGFGHPFYPRPFCPLTQNRFTVLCMPMAIQIASDGTEILAIANDNQVLFFLFYFVGWASVWVSVYLCICGWCGGRCEQQGYQPKSMLGYYGDNHSHIRISLF